MNRLIPVFICFTLLLAANCQDAASIIKKIAERNRALEGYRVEGGIELYRAAGQGNMSTGTKFLIEAADKTTKLHIEYQNPSFSIVLITDGSTIWTYMPHDKAYTKVQASAIADTGDQGEDGSQNDNIAMSVYSMAVRRYASLDKNPSRSELAGEEIIKTADGRVRCWILQTNVSGHMEKLWVDQQRYLVLRAESTFDQEGIATHMKISIKRFDVEPPAPTAFTFVPDKHAKLVDELNVPGSNPTFVGKPAADFALKNLDGEPVHLSEFRGKIVVLNFWRLGVRHAAMSCRPSISWQNSLKTRTSCSSESMTKAQERSKASTKKIITHSSRWKTRTTKSIKRIEPPQFRQFL
jgi:outer membrane lipoprotein-sorting protein